MNLKKLQTNRLKIKLKFLIITSKIMKLSILYLIYNQVLNVPQTPKQIQNLLNKHKRKIIKIKLLVKKYPFKSYRYQLKNSKL